MEYLLEWLLQIWDFMANFMLCLIRTGCIMRNIVLHIHIFLAVALIALVSGGCRDRHAAELLVRADGVMEESPDSARTLLADIDSTRLRGADLALYAVLDAQSRHKLNMEAPSDTLLNIAVDHYIAHGPDSLLMKALFYRAVGYKQRGDEIKMIHDVSDAWELGNRTNQPYWTARTAELIADINRLNCNRQEEIQWRKVAALQYEIAGRKDNYLFSLCDAVIPMSNDEDPLAALTLIDSLYPLVRGSEIPWLEDYYYEVSIPVLTYYGDPERGEKYIERLDSMRKGELSVDYLLYSAHLDLRRGRFGRAETILEEAGKALSDGRDTMRYWSECMNLKASIGKYREAYEFADSVTDSQYRWFQAIMGRPNLAIQRDFYQSRYLEMSGKADRNFGWLKLAGIVFLFSVAGTISFFQWKRYRFRKELTSIKNEVFSLRDQMRVQEKMRKMLEHSMEVDREVYRNDLSRLSETLTENDRLKDTIMLHLEAQRILYREKWDTLNMLCKELFESEEMDDRIRKQRMASVKKNIVALRDKKHKKKLEEAVDRYMDNIISRLRSQWRAGTENDFELAVMILAGFSANTVAFFTGIRSKYFYNLKSRLIEKIEKSEAPDRAEFVAKIREC